MTDEPLVCNVVDPLVGQVASLAWTLDAIGRQPDQTARAVAGNGLAAVLAFLREADISGATVSALQALSNELLDVELNGRHGPILTGPKPAHRPNDTPVNGSMKGRLAAVAELRREGGHSIKHAAEWVARHVPPSVAHALGKPGPLKGRAVEDWHNRFSCGSANEANRDGIGRAGYLAMTAVAKRVQPNRPMPEAALLHLLRSMPGTEKPR